jgi:hypothetical protein
MNKKIFASALIAIAAFASAGASAAVTYGNSVNAAGYAQTKDAVVAQDGVAVRANDLIITTNAVTDIPAKAEIIVKLPKGLNFSGSPSYLVSAPTGGLTLVDDSVSGDPTLTEPAISLSDTDGDGMMDRAVVTAKAASAAGITNTVTISSEIMATSKAKAGAAKVSIIVNGSLANTVSIGTVVAALETPVQGSSGTSLTTVDQKTNTDKGVSTATIVVTIPAGTLAGKTITLTPQAGVKWASSGSTATIAVHSPVAIAPVNSSAFGAAGATSAITFTTTGSTTVGSKFDAQINISINVASATTSTVTGPKGVTVGGTALITGTAALFDVKKNGSKAAVTLSATNKAPKIVAGSSSAQILPAFTITENFGGDAVNATTKTITITPGAGLKFGATDTIKITGTGWGAGATTATITAGVLTLNLTNTTTGSKTVTISGLKATAASTAAGTLTMTVGKPGTDLLTAPSDVVEVATAVARGTVTLAGPKKVIKTGPGATAGGTVTMTESTYGALTTINKSDVQSAYFLVTPSNAKITSMSVTTTNYGSSGPTVACSAQTGVTTGAWVCTVSAESSALPKTPTISVVIGATTSATAAVGSDVVMTFDGNAGVSGTATMASVVLTTTATKGQVPDLTPGSLEAKALAPVTISETFTGAMTNTVGSSIRLIAPAGVAFQDAASVVTGSKGTVGTATITSTFSPNDTLVMNRIITSTIKFTPKAVIASGVKGWLSFSIVDGDIDGKKLSNITNETIMMAYADGTLGKVDAGADATVNIGFQVSNTADGGLAPYTVKSSDSAIASVALHGDVVTVTGKAAGNATVTVTDELGGSDTYVVTVSAGATQPEPGKTTKTIDGSTSDATFSGGASLDGGATYTSEITTADDVSIMATINVDPADQGSAGAIHALVLSPAGFLTLEEDGSWVPWDGTLGGIATYSEETALGDVYYVPLYNGTIAAPGKWRFAVAYTTEDGKLVFNTKVAHITVVAE